MKEYQLKNINKFTGKEKIDRFNKLHKSVKEYIDYVNSNKFHPDNDYTQYLYEDLIREIAGNEFWSFYNKKVKQGGNNE